MYGSSANFAHESASEVPSGTHVRGVPVIPRPRSGSVARCTIDSARGAQDGRRKPRHGCSGPDGALTWREVGLYAVSPQPSQPDTDVRSTATYVK
jgi:hypothetical protein